MASDIQTTHFLFRYMPQGWHPYIKLARLDRPIGTWLLLLPCWWGVVLARGGITSMGWVDVKLFILFAIGALAMRGAGCVVNDLWDIEFDRQVARTSTRPLPAGEVTRKQALAFCCCLSLVGLAVLVVIDSLSEFILAVLSLGLISIYPAMKRITWWPQFFLGLAFNWGALMGFAAVNDAAPPPAAYILYFAGVFWTLAYDTIYAHQDKEDDALIGVKSTARLFGQHSKRWISCFFAAAIFLFMLAKWMSAASVLMPLMTLPIVAHAVWQLRGWDMQDPASALARFRSNRDFGLLVLLMLAL